MAEAPTTIDSLRRGLKSSKDPRVTRTRQAIIDAVHSLTADRAGSIGVAEIVRTAKVSRSTFYSHFASLDMLALYIWEQAQSDYGDEDSNALPSTSSTESLRAAQRRLVAQYDENRSLYLSVLTLMTHEVFVTATRLLAESFAARMRAVRVPEGVDVDATAVVLAGGALSLLNSWIRSEIDLSQDELVDHLMAQVPEWLVR